MPLAIPDNMLEGLVANGIMRYNIDEYRLGSNYPYEIVDKYAFMNVLSSFGYELKATSVLNFKGNELEEIIYFQHEV